MFIINKNTDIVFDTDKKIIYYIRELPKGTYNIAISLSGNSDDDISIYLNEDSDICRKKFYELINKLVIIQRTIAYKIIEE